MEVEIKLKLKCVRDDYPEKSGEYLCLTNTKEWITLHYSAKHKIFNARDEYPAEEAERTGLPVVWWAELPKF